MMKETYKQLWTAVIEQAVKDAQGAATTYAYREGAREWFACEDEGVGSLAWICGILDVDSNFIRAGLASRVNRASRFSRSAQEVFC